jgi:hypothetical protein
MARSTRRKSWMGIERYVAALIRSVPTKPNCPIFQNRFKKLGVIPIN